MIQIVVLSHAPSSYLNLAYSNGRDSIDYLSERLVLLSAELATLAPTAERPLLLIPASTDPPRGSESWEILRVEDGEFGPVLSQLDAHLDQGVEQIAWIDLNAPFFRVDLALFLYRLHTDNWCDYTFGDGFPSGYAVQWSRRDILKPLSALAESRTIKWNRDALFETLSVDINAFDIETEAAHEDWAMMRANLTVETRADLVLCRRIVDNGVSGVGEFLKLSPDSDRFPDHEDPMLRLLLEKPEIRRTTLRYVYAQVTESLVQRPFWTPWADERWAPSARPRAMEVDTWREIIDALYQETPESIVSIGYRGEPALHPAIPDVLGVAADYPSMTFYVETDGTSWDETGVAALINMENLGAVIVTIDAVDKASYEKMRGSGYDRVIEFVDTLAAARPGVVYVQATRMEENEELLPVFYKMWNERPGVTPIIEKYNGFAGRLPDRRPADLTPLDRPACVHLERDLVVLVDGSVVRCHQDLDREAVRGVIGKDTVAEIWERGAVEFGDHLAGRYSELCRSCDEYYTFNV